MPRYVIERQYLVPVYEHVLIEAPTFEDACRNALDDIEEPWGDNAQTDYESARCTTIERAVELPEQVQADGADEGPLSHFLFDAGLEPLPIPREFAGEADGSSAGVGFV
ncbi:MAG TPA: hypothetical protein VFC56_09850 [Stellaceae bacterium]|nr:hypothetical protein [Stellaceae bacterium]